MTIDYLLLLAPYHPTLGSPAHTQYGDLPLMQLVSLTGMWSLTFLVSWLAPVVNEVWEQGVSPRVLRYSLLPFALVLAGVLVYGSARLTRMPLDRLWFARRVRRPLAAAVAVHSL